MKTFSTLRAYQQKLALETSAAALFPDPLVLPFCSQRTVCPDCQAPLQVYKTQDRTVRLLDLGRFTAHETLLWCSGCQKVHASELSQLVAPGCTVGYDVLVWVGRALFLRDQRTEDIVAELATRRVHLSQSEVGYLARKFVIYLALAHRQTAPEQQSVMRAQGGYILHLVLLC